MAQFRGVGRAVHSHGQLKSNLIKNMQSPFLYYHTAGLHAYTPTRVPIPLPTTGIPTTSSRDLNYFFNLAASSTAQAVSGPAYGGLNQVDMSATLVLMLFRQTPTHIKPIAERFHLGPADRQPLYALTAQPSPRSAAEFNELCIKRRDPIAGVWHSVCTSDIKPRLQLDRAGHFPVASLTMDAVPVWGRVASGRATFETSESSQGNRLRLWWGDRSSLGSIGDAPTLRLDFIMAGLITVLTIEMRSAAGRLATVAHALGLRFTPY
ncbi:hypothetical protein B0T22DRAFT_479286 [Podospora appendiculata]|uniref:Uncharacterized protein n=1 Tax=Podospora appendiculata TaxID=314037 RepID=A0AAE0X8V3_9PEZI|nr:hypothetical protein B0T22DRAFT_479286 [Podospora appendiculata]